MVCELKSGETVLTGLLEDRSALFGVIAQIEALGLELVELRRSEPCMPGPAATSDEHDIGVAPDACRQSPASGEDDSPGPGRTSS
jgi:hypothetical protein